MHLLYQWTLKSIQSFWIIFKIMLPVSIVVKILQETNGIYYIGEALSPIMQFVGLPGEMGLVWATSMIANIYGGLIALVAIGSSIPLSVAQITILSTMILAAHTFPIELLVMRKAGMKIFPIFVLRFLGGFLLGWILHLIYNGFGLFQEPSVATEIFSQPQSNSFGYWLLNEVKNYVVMFCIILSLTILLEFLKKIKVIDHLAKILAPVLRVLGISKSVIPVTIIGLTLGIAYGGALIIQESKTEHIAKKDIFYALVLMSLCHSVIEDSILLMSLGASYTGVFIARILFAFLISWIIVKATMRLSEQTFQKLFLLKDTSKK